MHMAKIVQFGLHLVSQSMASRLQISTPFLPLFLVDKYCFASAGEMLVGPKRVLFMDDVSTGLDSTTAFNVVRNCANFVHLTRATILMSLLQPAPEVFEQFDDIMLLSEGWLYI